LNPPTSKIASREKEQTEYKDHWNFSAYLPLSDTNHLWSNQYTDNNMGVWNGVILHMTTGTI